MISYVAVGSQYRAKRKFQSEVHLVGYHIAPVPQVSRIAASVARTRFSVEGGNVDATRHSRPSRCSC